MRAARSRLECGWRDSRELGYAASEHGEPSVAGDETHGRAALVVERRLHGQQSKWTSSGVRQGRPKWGLSELDQATNERRLRAIVKAA